MDGNFVITGAASGFGREFSRRVVARGGRVLMADIDPIQAGRSQLISIMLAEFLTSDPMLELMLQGEEACAALLRAGGGPGTAQFQQADVTSREDWERLWTAAEQFLGDKIDVLVNNAGVSPSVGFEKCIKVGRCVLYTELGLVLRTEFFQCCE